MSAGERPSSGSGAGADPSCLALRARIAEAEVAGPMGSGIAPAGAGAEGSWSAPAELERSSTGTVHALAHLVLDQHEKRHVASCAACRSALTHAAPTALFGLLALESKPPAFWTGFETRILAEIRESDRSAGGWAAFLFRPRTLALAAGVSMIAAVAILGRVAPPDFFGGAPHRQAQAASGVQHHEARSDEAGKVAALGDQSVSATAARILPGQAGGALVPAHLGSDGSAVLPLERNAASPAPVEAVFSPSARVYTINVEDPLKEKEGSDVVVIVDTGIDI